MPSVGFEPAIPAGEWPQTQDIDRAATETSEIMKYVGFRPFLQATKALMVSRDISLVFSRNSALDGGGGLAPRPGRLYPRERPVTQGRSGREENIVRTGIRSRTVQPGSSVAIPTELPGPIMK